MRSEIGLGRVLVLALLALGGCERAAGAASPSNAQPKLQASIQAGPSKSASRAVVKRGPEPQAASVVTLGSSALRVAAGGLISFIEPELVRGVSPTVRFDVRDSDGSKTALVATPLQPQEHVRYRANAPGYASVHRCTRPTSLDTLPNAWQLADLCEITHVHVQDAGRQSQLRDRHLTSKIGLPIELRPYRSTATLRVGEELPVRLYQKGVPMPKRLVRAMGEQGQPIEAETNRKGVATFVIDAPGRWVITAELPDDALPSGRTRVRLVFEVEGN